MATGAPQPDATHPPVPVPALRWRRVLRGDEAQIRVLRRWLTELLPECGARDDVVAVAVELATNAIRHTGSGRGGLLIAEVTWHRTAVRVAVADGGAPQPPRVIEDPLAEHGRGMVLVRGLSSRMGFSGDHRGRLVWAEVPWTGDGATAPAALLPGYEAAIRDGQEELARRHRGTLTWFGRATQQWWALTGQPSTDSLVAADSPRELARLLDEMAARQPSRPHHHETASTQYSGTARADRRTRYQAPVPSRLHWDRFRARNLGTQPC